METAAFYTVREPTSWASAPEVLSHSALSRIKSCPLRFQLERSEFPGIGRFPARPNTAAVEGAVVHECLEALFKAFSIAGLPELGSEEARECASGVGLSGLIQTKLDEACRQFIRHPMGAGWKPRTPVYQLANRVIRLFRQQYTSIDHGSGYIALKRPSGPQPAVEPSQLAGWLTSSGALTELKLRHPTLPFEGIIDLVCRRNGETVIVDYKAGAMDSSHRSQLFRYALLWWRNTGLLPERIDIQYLSEKISEPVTEQALDLAERELIHEVDSSSALLRTAPAVATPGDYCGHCNVRQFCATYWEDHNPKSLTHDGFGDVELTICGEPLDEGFRATTSTGVSAGVTSSVQIGKAQFANTRSGQVLRLIGVKFEPQRGEIKVLASTEVWRLSN